MSTSIAPGGSSWPGLLLSQWGGWAASIGRTTLLSKLALNYATDDGNVDTISILCFDDLRNPGPRIEDLPCGDPGFFFAIKTGVFQLVR